MEVPIAPDRPQENPDKPETRVPDKAKVVLDTKEEAIALVKKFWEDMPHGYGRDLRFPVTSPDDWMEELTAGDRTRIFSGRTPKDKDKWIVFFTGNNQPFSKAAEKWLRERSLL